MTIDINELRLLVQDYKLAGSPVFVQSADMNELLDRLELAESRQATYREAFEISENTTRDLTEKVIPNIHEKLEAAERERDWNAERLEDAIEELKALRAKIEAAEKSDAESIAMYRKSRDERDALRAKVSDLMINAAFLDNLKEL